MKLAAEMRSKAARDLHVFLDESGGTDAANDTFLVAAVAVAPHDAARLVRNFHKATRTKGEVHGHRLDHARRKVFLDLLAREALSAAITCCRADPLGGWAMSVMPEADLYEHLLAEACATLPGFGSSGRLTVVPDGGRYARARLAAVRNDLTAFLASRHAGPVRVTFGDSASTAGLQVADVVANSVFQMLGSTASTRDLVAPLVATGRLTISPVRLPNIRPIWIAEG